MRCATTTAEQISSTGSQPDSSQNPSQNLSQPHKQPTSMTRLCCDSGCESLANGSYVTKAPLFTDFLDQRLNTCWQSLVEGPR